MESCRTVKVVQLVFCSSKNVYCMEPTISQLHWLIGLRWIQIIHYWISWVAKCYEMSASFANIGHHSYPFWSLLGGHRGKWSGQMDWSMLAMPSAQVILNHIVIELYLNNDIEKIICFQARQFFISLHWLKSGYLQWVWKQTSHN